MNVSPAPPLNWAGTAGRVSTTGEGNQMGFPWVC
jgi:hypothetical protein